ncbi:MAG: transcription-repair coupling factor [Syntrophomonadaceae bacterium]|nr:transcription-repair coupling factor [Syntrophomonadaceae bacterium]
MNRGFLSVVEKYIQNKENILLTGLSGTARAFLLAELFKAHPGKILCLLANEEKAYDLARSLQGFVERERIAMFLGRELVFMQENHSQVEVERILTLQDCLANPRRNAFIIATPGAFMYPFISPREMQHNTLTLQTGQEYLLREILWQLINSGYSRIDTLTRPGEFAMRGGILDIYSVTAKEPCRIEFFGDLIESIRHFDINSQRSGKKETSLTVLPADELSGASLNASLFDYLSEDLPVFIDEPREFYQVYDKNIKRYQESVKEAHREEKPVRELPLWAREELEAKLDSRTVFYHSFFSGNIPRGKIAFTEHVAQREMEPFYNNWEIFYARLREWQSKNYQVCLAIKSKLAREQMKKELSDQGISGVEISEQSLETGFSSSTLALAIISEKDIWGKVSSTRGRRPRQREERILLEDLKQGDYVVHESYGIGIFRGVTRVENEGVTREYILLQYAGTDKLYLPIDKLDLLYKFSSSSEKEPRLNKLGGNAWERTRKKVAESVQEMAEDLLKLYANRESIEGYAFSPDTPWQREFEDDFPYSETPDQLKAINDVKRAMERNRPVEHLICGDVGYGKTEVALRAAFKAVMDGKQVAILVPTTVLAEQHYHTFVNRFEKYPAIIEALSRFRSAAEQKRIINDIKKGVVDIVIATHRLLSKDVQFKDLGLLVIDEEHRFGVAQKEKIKALKEMVDVISLSATPIPRSLHMALTGLRDLSLIETPPPERYPVTTYVLEYNEEIIADAIRNEIGRRGQVFFVHNRIEDIYKVKEHLDEIFPGIKIALGHGRMKEDELARVMMDFVAGHYQLFLCTTIIESGLDMPNVNTLIVDEADRLGLAQLYQLRGRVGRSNRLAYAYLTYRPDRIISETAQKRLNAIREFNELGSGMKIALRDLEIRGAGNILGPEQHGYIHAVGFDLYCRLLEQETARLKGQSRREEINPQLDIDVDYYIPDTYIPDSGTKMRIYRRLLLARNYEEVNEIGAEMLDRFGPLPRVVENFLQIALLRITAKEKEISSLRRKGRKIEIQMAERLPADFAARTRDLNITKLDERTFLMQQEKTSLLDLQGVLNSI